MGIYSGPTKQKLEDKIRARDRKLEQLKRDSEIEINTDYNLPAPPLLVRLQTDIETAVLFTQQETACLMVMRGGRPVASFAAKPDFVVDEVGNVLELQTV